MLYAGDGAYGRNSQIVQVQKMSICGVPSHKWDIYIIIGPLKTQGTSQKMGGKSVRAKDWGRPGKISISWIFQD